MQMDTLLPTQPETYWQLLRRSIRLYRVSFKKVALLAVLLAITAFVPRLLSYAIGQDVLHNLTLFSLNQLWLTMLNLVAFIFFIAIIWHMHCEIIHKHESLREDFSIGFKKVITVFIASTLQSVLVIAIIAIIIASQMLIHYYLPFLFESGLGIWIVSLIFLFELTLLAYIATLFIFIVPLVAIENKGILSSIQRSITLVWNHWWRTVTLQATPWICFILVLAFVKFILKINVHIYFIDQVPHPLLLTILQIIIFAIFIPWVAALLLVQLQDLELRNNSKKARKKIK